MNNVNIVGHLTADIDLRTTDSGKHVISFCVAVDGSQDRTYFVDCVAWEARADNIKKYFHKGDKIGISGMITTRNYEKDGQKRKVTEVLVTSFDFCNGKKSESTEVQESETETEVATDESVEEVVNNGEALPFEI